MTSTRGDIPRLAASLAVLGTELEQKGQLAFDTLSGWEVGPRPAPKRTDDDETQDGQPNPSADDHREEMRQAAVAGRYSERFRRALAALDAARDEVSMLLDHAIPPHPADLKNRRTGEIDPETPGDIAVAGYCVSCWRNDKQMVLREKAKKSGLYYSPRYCRWCMDVKRAYDIEPPLDILKLHHAGRRISVQSMEEAVARAKPKAGKGKKRRKGKAA